MNRFLVLMKDTFSKWAVLAFSSPPAPAPAGRGLPGVSVFALPGRSSQLFLLEAIT